MSAKFRIGDKIRVVQDFDCWLDQGSDLNQIFEVVEENDSGHVFCPVTNTCDLDSVNDWPEDFEIVNTRFSVDLAPEAAVGYTTGIGVGIAPPSFTTLPCPLPKAPELGLYRPNLEDRKVGKVPMHMVTDGFPHALQHIAEIMGWAADTKGYKLHDWKNLPNADIEFPSAADRHGNDNSKQKSTGLRALERVDHESSKLHIGHKVFNLLAELELVLTGKIK